MAKDLRSCDRWLDRAEGALSGVNRLELEAFNDLSNEGENLKIDRAVLKKVRQQVKLAKAWRLKVKKTGLEKGHATTAQLRLLLPEAEAILVDLTEEIEVIKLATSRYCVCRKATPDQLVVCRSCRSAYHGSCIALDPHHEGSQDFTCARCAVRAAYEHSLRGIDRAATVLAERLSQYAATIVPGELAW